MDFHSIAHYLKDESGHFYHYQLSLQEAVEALSLPFTAYVQRDASLSSPPPRWVKAFHSIYNKKSRSLFFKDCRTLFHKQKKQQRLFFLEFFKRGDFVLIALAALLFVPKRDHFWILYRDDLTTRRKKDLKTIKFFSKLLEWKFRKKFLPLTDSEGLAHFYQNWFSQKIEILPIMHVRYNKIQAPSKRKKRLILSWPGAPRPEKGLKEIQTLVQLQDPYAQRFILELSGATPYPVVSNGLEVQLQKMQLTQEEYFENLLRADVILLPYDPEKYKWRTSGIFVEAIAAGKIPVVKKGSWLAEELLRFDLSELILSWDNPLFFTHLFETIYNNDILIKIQRMQESYFTFHCKEHFHKRMKELINRSK